MSDHDDDKKNIDQDSTGDESDNQSLVEENNQSEIEESSNEGSLNDNNAQNNDQPQIFDTANEKKDENQDPTAQNNESSIQDANETQNSDVSSEKKDEDNGSGHQVIHKKDGRLHIYVRQDKYKGELKSKNWVGRLYIDGKQKISSSGTQNLDEAIPILEKWFDDIHAESERLKKQNEQSQTSSNNEQPANLEGVNETKVPSPNVTTTATTQTEVAAPQISQPVVNQSF